MRSSANLLLKFHPTRFHSAQSAAKTNSSAKTIAGLLESQVSLCPTKDALWIRPQKLEWNLSQLKSHTYALACGLNSLGLSSGSSNVLSTLSVNAEHITASFGCALASFNFTQLQSSSAAASNASSLRRALQDVKAEVLFISGDESEIEGVYTAMPELTKVPRSMDRGLSAYMSDLPKLKYIVHTGREIRRGMLRYKDILCYNASYFPISSSESQNSKVLSVYNTDNGKMSVSLSEKELMDKAAEIISKLSLAQEGKVIFNVGAVEPDLTATLVACLQKFGKLVIPTPEESSVEDVRKYEPEEAASSIVTFAAGTQTKKQKMKA